MIKDLTKLKTGYTHSGRFHTDDILCAVFLKHFNPDIEIKRVSEIDFEPKEDEIVFDIGLGEFDHHQEDRRIDDNGHPYCAFGLLWEAYGKQYLKDEGFTKINQAFNRFKKRYVYKVDQGDNEGYGKVRDFHENKVLTRFNPLWFELTEGEDVPLKQFNKACDVATTMFKVWTQKVRNEVEPFDYRHL